MQATPENIEKLTESLTVCRDYVKLLKSDLHTKDEEIGKLNATISDLESTILNLQIMVKNLKHLPPASIKKMRHDEAYDALYKSYETLYRQMEEQEVVISKLEKTVDSLQRDKTTLLISLHEKKG